MEPKRVGRPPRELREGEDPERVARKRAQDRERYYQDDPKVRWAKAAFHKAKQRAMAAAVAFEISTADILERAGERCPALNIELDYSRGRLVIQDDSPTVDRIVPHLGYVPSNIAVISNKANTCKSRCGPAELMDVGRWLMRVLAPEAINGGLCAS